MRLLFTLLLIVAIAPAHAEGRPEPLVDRPLPKVKLNASLGWRLTAVVHWERAKDIFGDRKKDADVIVIKGDVINNSTQERATPKVLFRVLGHDGTEIFTGPW